ncbi:MAG: glycosyltransferase [Patescibacteria group bacterium]
MKVALVHDFFTQWGGAERVLKVFSEIYPDAPIYLIVKDQQLVDEFLPGRKVIPSFLQDYPGMPNQRKFYFPLMPRAIESFDFSGFDLVLSSSSAYAKGIITKPPTKHICYLHTPTRYLTVDTEQYLADAPIPWPIIGRPIVRMLIKRLQKWDLQASKRPDYLIANSTYIYVRTKQFYGRVADAIVFPPVDTNQFKIADKIGDYWLTLGRNEPYKRTDIAILAAKKLGLKLKVVGGGSDLDNLKKIAGKKTEFLGRVPDSELAKLYAGAIGLIFPPREDAGMTSLEAMACGRPVIAFGEGGSLETVKHGVTGEFFPEQSVESLVAVLEKFDPAKYDPQTIREHVMQFDTKRFKQKIQEIVQNNL